MRSTHSNPPSIAPITVTFNGPSGPGSAEFVTSFRIGRTDECDVCIKSDFVSRTHAEVVPDQDGWSIRDLNSSNGIYLQGEKVQRAALKGEQTVRLGKEGPEIRFTVAAPSASPNGRNPHPPDTAGEATIVAQYADRYFREPQHDEEIGEHTRFVRQAFAQVQGKEKRAVARRTRLYLAIIALLVIAGGVVSAYTYRLRQETLRQRAVARNLFYAMKSLDVEIAEAERIALAADKQQGSEAVSKFEARRQEIQTNYDQVLASQHIYDPTTTEEHRLILRVARIFGECELDMPPDFEKEVMKYIKYWQSSGRYARDIHLAQQKGYTRKIPQALLERGLPVQFFYLAMQESDFDPFISGPITRKGFAKGMWQFIPETGVKYGLHLGPLVDLPRADPSDERDQVDKATEAATRYLETLYSTDAQASGLLVMACYNWGENQVLPLVRSMPPNPRERNFWRLLADHRDQIPQQTYDYVFYITSAAVIGENPRLFGFDFDNPLER